MVTMLTDNKTEDFPAAKSADGNGSPPLAPADADDAATQSCQGDEDQKPAAMAVVLESNDSDHKGSSAAEEGMSEITPGYFPISNIREKGEHGAYLCSAVGCTKRSQSNTRMNKYIAFCRAHHNAWQIGTGQVESWDCECGTKVSMKSERCGKCHRWKDKKSRMMVQKGLSSTAKGNNANVNPMMHGLQISKTRRSNDKGRTLCKVIGCDKLDQTKNDGFCRMHFNMVSSQPVFSSINVAGTTDWICSCGQVLAGNRKRCGKCNKWRGGMRQDPISTTIVREAANSEGSNANGLGFVISREKRKNEKGRILCKVLGCPKLDQTKNDGFCRMHFNMVYAQASSNSNSSVGVSVVPVDSWTCSCGQSLPGKQKRCGKCNKWKGGTRDKYLTGVKRNSGGSNENNTPTKRAAVSTSNTHVTIGAVEGHWTCVCGNKISSTKSRCGKCHHWRNGMRKGGWKINRGGDGNIEWTQDWSCCKQIIPASRKRCGKCNGWRGGKRTATASSKPAKSEVKVEKGMYTVTEFI